MRQLILSNASILTPQGVVDGSVVAEEGIIVAVEPCAVPGGIDLGGALVAPGFIDLHNDGLEVEINPRPGVGLPLQFALHNFDLRAAGAGLTLAFHAITFADFVKKDRSIDAADQRTRAIRALGPDDTIAQHEVLFRADVWQPEGVPALLERARDWETRIVTINDHTPGQGQYRDIDGYKRFIREWAGRSDADIERATEEKMAFAREHPEVGEHTLALLREGRRDLGLVLGSHDDDTPERCTLLHDVGATIAEFPVTIEAAERARELGMTIVAGAPNIVRGGSHSGNVSVLELVERGLCDILVADYHAPSLMLAVQRLVEGGVLPLEQAIALVTTNAARAINRPERATIVPGNEATFTLIRRTPRAAWRAAGVVRNGRIRAQFEELSQRPQLLPA